MDLGDIVVSILCLLWVAVCGARWYITPRQSRWQRHFFAFAAGLGAALFWIFGQMTWTLMFPPIKPAAGQDILVHPAPTAPAKP